MRTPRVQFILTLITALVLFTAGSATAQYSFEWTFENQGAIKDVFIWQKTGSVAMAQAMANLSALPVLVLSPIAHLLAGVVMAVSSSSATPSPMNRFITVSTVI